MSAAPKPCECGCGESPLLNCKTGKPQRYLLGHNRRGKHNASGPENGFWRGGSYIDKDGYRRVWCGKGYVAEQRLVVERVTGKPLPRRAVVHHVNEDRLDNSPGNLVVCEHSGYHQLLHARLRRLRACGNPNFRACALCKSYDRQDEMVRGGGLHRNCNAARVGAALRRKREAAQ